MKLSKKIFTPLLVSTFSLVSTTVLVCSCSSNSNTYTFVLSTPSNEGDYNVFANNVAKKFNELKAKDETTSSLADITINVKNIDDKQTKLNSVLNGSADFTFVTARYLYNNDVYLQVKPLIQTLTTPFTFDTDISQVYKDGSETDPLRVIANNMQKASFGSDFVQTTSDTSTSSSNSGSSSSTSASKWSWDSNSYHYFSQWKDAKGAAPNYDWNGVRYNAFYDTSAPLVAGYRGMIVLSGSDDKIQSAIEAWDKRDWNSFRNLGIVLGENGSTGNYLLEQSLIKQHFTSLGQDFTLANDRSQNPGKYDTDSSGTYKIGKDSNFVITFSDEGSFSWTHNDNSNQDFSPINNNKIKILTVTNPANYDIGIFSKSVDTKIADLLTQAIVALAQDDPEGVGVNSYGAGMGYNGFSKISDFKKEVYDPMQLALG